MFFSPRIRIKTLAQLCHRLAISTSAGIQDIKTWENESQRGSRQQQRHIKIVADGLKAGHTLSQSLAATQSYFPPLFRQMVDVGDVSGQLDKTYKRLAEHYDNSLAAKRAFLGKLGWPGFQLGIALFVVGVLIVVMGMLPGSQSGQSVDMLGFGLIGTSGLFIYINFLIICAIVLLLLIESMRRGAIWVRPLQHAVVKLPVVGQAFQTLALARFTWTFQLVLGTSMDLRKSLPLVLDATGNDYYARFGSTVAGLIERGADIRSALASTGAFPQELLENIAVGEQSGSLAEVMQRLSKEYRERAATAISVIAQVAGYLVWLLVASIIVLLIFRLASTYLGTIQEALKPI